MPAPPPYVPPANAAAVEDTAPAPASIALNAIQAHVQLQVLQNDIQGAAKTLMTAREVHGRSAEYTTLARKIRVLLGTHSLSTVKILVRTQTGHLPPGIQRLAINPEQATLIPANFASADYITDHASHLTHKTNFSVNHHDALEQEQQPGNDTQYSRIQMIQQRIANSMRQKMEIESTLGAGTQIIDMQVTGGS
jgi:hypothetical protein